jgi:hypothetical protein
MKKEFWEMVDVIIGFGMILGAGLVFWFITP